MFGLIQCKLVDCCISVSLFGIVDQAKEEEKHGKLASARAKANISLGLSLLDSIIYTTKTTYQKQLAMAWV